MKYYKRYNDKFYDFDEAYNLIEKNELKDIVMKVNNNSEFPSQIEVNWEMINKQHKNISIPVWAAKSDKWELWVSDYEKQELADNISNWIKYDLGFELDTRFWKDENMDINDWWNQLEAHILTEEDHLEIMNFLKKSGRLQGQKERNKKIYK